MTESFAVPAVRTAVYDFFLLIAGTTSKTYYFTTGKHSQDPVRTTWSTSFFKHIRKRQLTLSSNNNLLEIKYKRDH